MSRLMGDLVDLWPVLVASLGAAVVMVIGIVVQDVYLPRWRMRWRYRRRSRLVWALRHPLGWWKGDDLR